MDTYAEYIKRDIPLLERSCYSKARFDSRREANALARHGHRSDSQLKPYHCDNCSSWHLGHSRTRKARHARATAGRGWLH
jgi:hypothetical protein